MDFPTVIFPVYLCVFRTDLRLLKPYYNSPDGPRTFTMKMNSEDIIQERLQIFQGHEF